MKILYITGAGISKDSGIPTYRGKNNSLYSDNNIVSLMNKSSIKNKPQELIEYLNNFKNLVDSKQPNESHFLLTELIKENPSSFVVTQNIDNFHEKSGLDSSNLFHMHGSLYSVRHNSEIKDVVLFDEHPKLNSLELEAFLTPNNTDYLVLIGTSLTVISSILDLILDYNYKHVYLINPTEASIDLFYTFKNRSTHIREDSISGLKTFKKIIQNNN